MSRGGWGTALVVGLLVGCTASPPVGVHESVEAKADDDASEISFELVGTEIVYRRRGEERLKLRPIGPVGDLEGKIAGWEIWLPDWDRRDGWAFHLDARSGFMRGAEPPAAELQDEGLRREVGERLREVSAHFLGLSDAELRAQLCVLRLHQPDSRMPPNVHTACTRHVFDDLSCALNPRQDCHVELCQEVERLRRGCSALGWELAQVGHQGDATIAYRVDGENRLWLRARPSRSDHESDPSPADVEWDVWLPHPSDGGGTSEAWEHASERRVRAAPDGTVVLAPPDQSTRQELAERLRELGQRIRYLGVQDRERIFCELGLTMIDGNYCAPRYFDVVACSLYPALTCEYEPSWWVCGETNFSWGCEGDSDDPGEGGERTPRGRTRREGSTAPGPTVRSLSPSCEPRGSVRHGLAERAPITGSLDGSNPADCYQVTVASSEASPSLSPKVNATLHHQGAGYSTAELCVYLRYNDGLFPGDQAPLDQERPDLERVCGENAHFLLRDGQRWAAGCCSTAGGDFRNVHFADVDRAGSTTGTLYVTIGVGEGADSTTTYKLEVQP